MAAENIVRELEAARQRAASMRPRRMAAENEDDDPGEPLQDPLQ